MHVQGSEWQSQQPEREGRREGGVDDTDRSELVLRGHVQW